MKLSRRKLLIRSGGMVTAACVPMALGRTGAFAANMPDTSTSEGATVTAVSQVGVQVAGRDGAIRTEGFPEAWVVKIGDRVGLEPTLAGEAVEIRAFPMVHWTTRVLGPAEVTPGAKLPSDPSLVVDPAAIIVGRPPSPGQAASVRLSIVDRGTGTGPGPDRVISARW